MYMCMCMYVAYFLDIQDEQQLWALIVKLCDILFDGYQTQLASIE